MSTDSPEQWLKSLPLDELVNIDGESVFLRVQPEGAELGVCLIVNASDATLADALRTSFQGALEFEAGLGWEQDGQRLVLTQWLPSVGAWSDVPEALEKILNQASLWRAAMSQVEVRQEKSSRRVEERFRKLLAER
jgi:hypothetical protein